MELLDQRGAEVAEEDEVVTDVTGLACAEGDFDVLLGEDLVEEYGFGGIVNIPLRGLRNSLSDGAVCARVSENDGECGGDVVDACFPCTEWECVGDCLFSFSL